MKKLFIMIMIIISPVSALTPIGCSALASTLVPDKQEIVISYSSIIYTEANIWFDTSQIPGSGTQLVIVNLIIENRGYAEFETNINYFSAVVNGVAHNYDPECYANDLLPETKIASGGVAKGNVPYTLPVLTRNSSFTMQYTGPGHYNISWIRQQ